MDPKIRSDLFSLLSQDQNVHDLYRLSSDSASFEELMKKHPEFTEQQMIDLIELISQAETTTGMTLFDARYHFFIKSPNRAFITLGKNKQIFFGNRNEIDGMRAFEVGRCHNCSHLFIIGRVIGDYLVNDDTIDIYENYEDSEYEGLRFFVLEPENEFKMKKYRLCTKCGRIHDADVINPRLCDCGPQYEVSVWDAGSDLESESTKASSRKKLNNLTQCPHCSRTNYNAGMVNSFRLSQDRATSILGNIYLNTLYTDHLHLDPVPDEDLGEDGFDLFSDGGGLFDQPGDSRVGRDDKEPYFPQVLAFSDSRSQASQFAVRMDEIHEKMLIRKLLIDISENQQPLTLNQVVVRLKERFEAGNLFEEHPEDHRWHSYESRAWGGILRDLFFLDGTSSAESIGLYSFDIDYSEISKMLNQSRPRQQIEGMFNLTPDEFIHLIRFCLLKFRKDPIINYSDAALTETEVETLFGYKSERKGVVLRKSKDKNEEKNGFVLSFLPVNDKSSNILLDYLKKITGFDTVKVRALAENLFRLLINLKLLYPERIREKQVYQMKMDHFRIQSGAHTQWYRCSKCGQLTTVNIHNVCPRYHCQGHLELYDPQQTDNFIYLRNEILSTPETKRVCQEHTAQLKPKVAKKYQEEFKNKKISLLSSSTTFEVGVDLGSLENVFMRDVPPSPANYVQRAGRAGRSKDAAALIVTYCLAKSHDYYYFQNPQNMINGIVAPPVFSLVNKKIVLRHLTSTALGFYFRMYPEDYEHPFSFLYEEDLTPFIEYLKSRPEDLRQLIDTYLLTNDDLAEYRNYGWLDYLFDEHSSFEMFIRDAASQLKSLEMEKNAAIISNDPERIQYAIQELNNLERCQVIDTLSRNAVIPKYGFPVDVVDLTINQRTSDNDARLQRDLKMAISEYAPESEVIVNKKKYVSRYVRLPRNGSLETWYYTQCPNCKTTLKGKAK